jgi:hypothetical protein
MPKLTHWTERSVEDFLYKIAADFVQQIENYLGASGENRADFAKKLGRTPGRVSQVLNAPGNLTLRKIIEYARAANKKVAIVAYDDDDPTNSKGLVNSQVFEQCWLRYGRPTDFFALDEANQVTYWTLTPENHNRRLPMPPVSAVRGNYDTRSFGPSATASTRADTVMKTQHYAEAGTDRGAENG